MSGKVDVKGGGKRAREGVVVYLKNVPGRKNKRARATIRQKDQKFHDKVTVVVVGTTVDFPNEDKVAHNVYSNTRRNVFDLGEYKGGHSKSHRFKRTGDVDVHCNIHVRMAAKVKVLDNSHYTRTDAHGRFSLPSVPAGTYTIVTWLPNAVEKTKRVTILAGKTEKVRLEIQVGRAPSRHKRKDGTTYGRGY